MDEFETLLDSYIASDPRLEIWRQYPDISEEEDDYADGWACEEISAEFAAFARELGWDADAVHGADPAAPLAFDHAWVRLSRHGKTFDVDWTARQYHNLHDHDGHDPAVLTLPWPLTWDPIAVGVDAHPIVGKFAAVTKEDQ